MYSQATKGGILTTQSLNVHEQYHINQHHKGELVSYHMIVILIIL